MSERNEGKRRCEDEGVVLPKECGDSLIIFDLDKKKVLFSILCLLEEGRILF